MATMNSRLCAAMALAVNLALLALTPHTASATQSVARQWNEVQLKAIRKDLARPTVQARNLFHFAIAVYDSWAAYDSGVSTYLLGNVVGNSYCPFNGIPAPADLQAARDETVSYAAYQVLRHCFSRGDGVPTLDEGPSRGGRTGSRHGCR